MLTTRVQNQPRVSPFVTEEQPKLKLAFPTALRWFRNISPQAKIIRTIKSKPIIKKQSRKLVPNKQECTTLKIQLGSQQIKIKMGDNQNLRNVLLNTLIKKRKALKKGLTFYFELADRSSLITVPSRLLSLKQLSLRVRSFALSDCCPTKNLQFFKVLGQGSFSKVVLTRNLKDGNFYAAKVFTKACQQSIRILQNQLLLLKSLRHHSIVRLYSSFQTQQFVVLLLQFCSQGNLFQLLTRRSLNELQVKFIAKQIVEALIYLHSNQVIFRDLKLQNVVINQNSKVKLCDFGLSKFSPSGTLNMTFCGSPDYLAPQIISREGYDSSIDLYSLGKLLFELLTKDLGQPSLGQTCTLSRTAKDLIQKLLSPKQKRAEFFKSTDQVLRHEWFNNSPQECELGLSQYSTLVQQDQFFLNMLRQQMGEVRTSRFFYQRPEPQERGLSFQTDELQRAAIKTLR